MKNVVVLGGDANEHPQIYVLVSWYLAPLLSNGLPSVSGTFFSKLCVSIMESFFQCLEGIFSSLSVRCFIDQDTFQRNWWKH